MGEAGSSGVERRASRDERLLKSRHFLGSANARKGERQASRAELARSCREKAQEAHKRKRESRDERRGVEFQKTFSHLKLQASEPESDRCHCPFRSAKRLQLQRVEPGGRSPTGALDARPSIARHAAAVSAALRPSPLVARPIPSSRLTLVSRRSTLVSVNPCAPCAFSRLLTRFLLSTFDARRSTGPSTSAGLPDR